MEVGEPGDGGLRKLQLKLGDDGDSLVTFFSTEVYSFRPARESTSASSGAAERHNALHSMLGMLSVQETNESKIPDASTSAVGRGGPKDTIDNSDIMTALQGLLSRAGVPISLDEEVSIARYKICLCCMTFNRLTGFDGQNSCTSRCETSARK